MDLYKELFNCYGAVKRAKGCYLYTTSGVRVTDIYMNGAAAILGRGGRSKNLKNILSRALPNGFFTPFSFSLDKAISNFFGVPYKTKILFYSREQFLENNKLLVYKPFLSVPSGAFIFPLEVQIAVIYILCTPVNKGLNYNNCAKDTPQKSEHTFNNYACDFCNTLEVAASKEIFALKKFTQNYCENDFNIYDGIINKYWERHGAYLTPIASILNNYEDFALYMLKKCQIFINPYKEDSIVPLVEHKNAFNMLKKYPYDNKNI